MKSLLFLLPLILATSAAVADAQRSSPAAPVDAQTHAAALLRSTHASVTSKEDGLTRSTRLAASDAQASAAALLGGRHASRVVDASRAIEQPSGARSLSNAQTQAAALLRGSRQHAGPPLRAQTGSTSAR